MNVEKLRRSPSGRLVRIPNDGRKAWAFVPNPLAPEIEFDVELVWLLSEADRVLGELSGLVRKIPNPQLFVGAFMRRDAVHSSAIAGIRASVEDIYAYEADRAALPGIKSKTPEHDVREVLNYVRAMEYGLRRIDEIPMSLRLICELHARLLEGVAEGPSATGEFRHSQNMIGPPGCSLKNAVYVPPPVEEMLQALDAFENYLYNEDRLPLMVRLALTHYQFGAIHPFEHGNGRIGRLLTTLLSVHWSMQPEPMLCLSSFFRQKRSEHDDLLLAVGESGAWKPWIAFFLQAVADRAADAANRVRRLLELQRQWREELAKARAATVLRLANSLFERPMITIAHAQQVLNVTAPNARHNIEQLVEAGILELIDPQASPKWFRAVPILDITAGSQ